MDDTRYRFLKPLNFIFSKRKYYAACVGCLLFLCLLSNLIYSYSAWEFYLPKDVEKLENKIAFLESSIQAKDDYLLRLKRELVQSATDILMHGIYIKGNASEITDADDKKPIEPAVAAFLKNISGTRTAASFHRKDTQLHHLMFLNHLMPHLRQQPRSLQPALLMSAGRQHVDVVLGVPTVQRDFDNYLMVSLESLVYNLSPEVANSTLIVVCIADSDPLIVLRTALQIEKRFSAELDSGLIDVIAPAPSYYPNLKVLLPTLSDSSKRHRWRAKHTLDMIYTMAYSHIKGKLYLMLEDDVISGWDYLKTIMNRVRQLSVKFPSWIVIHFTGSANTIGYGNLLRSSSLVHLILYMQLFYNYMPPDWLLQSYVDDLFCSPLEKNLKSCKSALIGKSIVEKSIFTHIGLYSSLNGKIHELSQKHTSSKLKLFAPHKNPPLSKVHCSMATYSKYTIKRAYEGKNFYWGKTPKTNDVCLFQFATPTLVKSFKFRTGNALYVMDKLLDAVVEIKLARNESAQRFISHTHFDELGIAEATLPHNVGRLEAIQIRVLKGRSRYWVVISEIEIKEEKDAVMGTTLS